jgi:hypothetical protein
MLKYVHHVHYLVRNRDAMVEYLDKNLGLKPDHMELNSNKDTNYSAYEAHYNIGHTQIQIAEPTDPTSPLGLWLAVHGPGVWHIGWAVDDLRKVAGKLVASGTKMKGFVASGHGYLTNSIDPGSAHGLWFQLVEDPRDK